MADLVAANRALTKKVEELTTKCDSLVVITAELGHQNSLLREKMHQLNAQLAAKDDQLADQGEELEGSRVEVGRLQGLVEELEGEVREWEGKRGGSDCRWWLCSLYANGTLLASPTLLCSLAADRQAAPGRGGVLEREAPVCVGCSG